MHDPAECLLSLSIASRTDLSDTDASRHAEPCQSPDETANFRVFMVRFIQDGGVVGAPALLTSRGDHLVLLSAADGGAALRASCPWLHWRAGEVEGDVAIHYGEFVYLIMRVRPEQAVLELTTEVAIGISYCS